MDSEILIVFLLAVGIVMIGWCLTGLLLLPVFSEKMVTLCCSKGDGRKLEQQVRAYGWLRDGNLSGGTFLIVDCGLDETGVTCAQRLCRDRNWVLYCTHAQLPDYFRSFEDSI